ncbi:hypothetical protein E2C01_102622 [Portunus trituberculatus]|uniref:Uncharacterized protein n=1 Tax=Portunus trituberculatus TaxID=210409 RepID=A0A5B7KIS6_PORTR|nr:hypothetical protein [Portunus trituberculatus]
MSQDSLKVTEYRDEVTSSVQSAEGRVGVGRWLRASWRLPCASARCLWSAVVDMDCAASPSRRASLQWGP